MENFGQLIIPLLVGVAIGWIIGIVDARLTKKMGDQRQEKKAAPPPAVPEKSYLSILPGEGQQLRVRLDGMPITAETISPDQRKRLISLVVLLRPLMEAAAPRPAPPPAPGPRPAAQPQPAAPPAPAKINLIQSVGDTVRSSMVKKPEKPPDSIVTMIDRVLQEKLARSPLAGRSISLEDGPHGSVHVVVDDKTYVGVDAVPDPQIQAIIRLAIEEWNRK